jgi:hypothetical protein
MFSSLCKTWTETKLTSFQNKNTRVADKKRIPVRHWVLQVREFCQTYQLFARPAFFLEIF